MAQVNHLDLVHEAKVLGLRCRECGREYPVAPIYTCEWCFGPLEVAYDYDAIARVDRAARRSRPGRASLWRYSDLLPVASDPSVDLGTGFTPLVRADRLAAELGPRRGLGQERHAQPDELVQGPRRLGRVEQGARVRLQGRGVRVDRQPRQLGRRARRARRPAQLRVHPVEPRAGQDRHDVGLRRQRRGDRRQLRRRQPPLRGARRHLRVGVREREHAPVLRRGLEDARVRDRRAARLADARPRRRARPRAARCSRRSRRASRSCTTSGCSTRSPTCVCRARRRSAARRSRRRGSTKSDTIRPGQARHDRQVARDREPGRRLLRARRGARTAAAGSRR